MEISNKKPLIWPLVHLFFPAARWGEVIVAWGPKIYAARPFSEDLLAHEIVHGVQQHMSKIVGLWWWFRYITSTKYRLAQEIPAHIRQWSVIVKVIKDRNALDRSRRRLATSMSSDVYKNMISFDEAYKLFL